MSSQTATPSTPSRLTRFADEALKRVVNKQWGWITNCALVFIGAMGGAPKTNSMCEVMTNLGAAFGNYEALRGTTCIITRLLDMFIDELDNSSDIKLAWIIIGYNGQSVAPNEDERETMLRVGAIITAETPIVPATAAPTVLPYKPCPEVIAMVETILKSEHTRCDDLRRVAEFTGVDVDDIYNLVDSEICIREQLKARLWGAIAQWKRV